MIEHREHGSRGGLVGGGREAAGRTEVRGEGGGKIKGSTAFMKMQ